MLPNIYCDVDGVLNIYDRKNDLIKIHNATRKMPSIGRYLPAVPFKFRFHQEPVSALVDNFLNNDLATLSWLTTWNQEAVNIVEPITGIRSKEVLHYKMRFNEIGSQRRKYLILKNHQIHNPSPFIWIDDVATKHYNPKDWVGASPHLVIRTERHKGVTMEHIDSISAFLNKLA